MSKQNKHNNFKLLFPFIVAISVISGLVYWTVQQDLRMSANDPQIQIAEDTAEKLNNGVKLTASNKVNIAQSLSSFIILYDKQGHPITSEAVLNGHTPVLPTGVLADTQKLGEDRLTWQPATGVRIAAVIIPYKMGFVLTGRNLREVEKREAQLTSEVSLSWVISTIAITIAFICINIL